MTHGAVRIYVWSLQGYCNAVEKYEDQHHMIKHFVGNDLLAHHSEPGEMEERKISFRYLGWRETPTRTACPWKPPAAVPPASAHVVN